MIRRLWRLFRWWRMGPAWLDRKSSLLRFEAQLRVRRAERRDQFAAAVTVGLLSRPEVRTTDADQFALAVNRIANALVRQIGED